MNPIIVVIISMWIMIEAVRYIFSNEKRKKIQQDYNKFLQDINDEKVINGKERYMSLNQKQNDQQARRFEREKREEDRIQKNYNYRPSVSEMIKDELTCIDENSLDYLNVIITGNAGEIQFLKIPDNMYESYRKVIEDEEEDEIDYNFDIMDQKIYTYLNDVYKAEFGTKNHYIHFKLEEEIKNDTKPFGDWIKYVNKINGDESGYLAIRYTQSDVHYMQGTIGLDHPIKTQISKSQIFFYNTFFQIQNFRFNYDDFLAGDFVDSSNEIYDIIIPFSNIDSLKPSDIGISY